MYDIQKKCALYITRTDNNQILADIKNKNAKPW